MLEKKIRVLRNGNKSEVETNWKRVQIFWLTFLRVVTNSGRITNCCEVI
jgi:hypothetical protein